MINKIIKDWVGEEKKEIKEDSIFINYLNGYNQALQDLTSRIPLLTERIINIMQKIVDDIYDEPEKTDDDVFEARVIEDLIDTLKGGKE